MTTSRKPDENDKARGRELARLRKAVGISQEQLAIRLGISAKQFGKYERGQNRVPAGRYEAAMRVLREQAGGSGFAESQAPYSGPDARREALLQSLENDLDILLLRMRDRLKLFVKDARRL